MDIIEELQSYGVEVLVHDPIADPAEAREHYGIELVGLERVRELGAVVIAVAHQEYRTMDVKAFGDMVCEGGSVVDVKGMLNGLDAVGNGRKIWRL